MHERWEVRGRREVHERRGRCMGGVGGTWEAGGAGRRDMFERGRDGKVW